MIATDTTVVTFQVLEMAVYQELTKPVQNKNNGELMNCRGTQRICSPEESCWLAKIQVFR